MMTIKAATRPTRAVIQREYRQRKGDGYRRDNAARMRAARGKRVTEFICVDGEGTGKGKDHRYVLLGVGDRQYENPSGIHWQEAFDFLYSQYEEHPNAAFVGFFLGYDFNQILKTLPEDKAALLLTRAGKAQRKPKKKGHVKYYPVRCEGWEFDMLGSKRLSIRPMCCATPWGKHESGCKGSEGWMSVCDAGPFFQMGFLKVIHPAQWVDDPDGPVCSEEEYRLVEKGKAGRGDDKLGEEMRVYNRLENEILSRVMGRVAKGLAANGVKLRKNQWYGPGAAAQAWLGLKDVPKRKDVEEWVPEWALNAAKAGYFGGWFEIFSHGIIGKKGSVTWNYDINSAYPYAISKLPCIRKGHGKWVRGIGAYRGTGQWVLCHVSIIGCSNRVGPVPFRRDHDNILRPSSAKGWYWLAEIQASDRAGLVESYTTDEWVSYEPTCTCSNPVKEVQGVYDYRLKVGKSSAAGKGAKLIANSAYGKFAQTVGDAPFGNWFYASRITADCRIQILDSIASHPGGTDSVLMVATDGIVFDKRHPGLTIGTGLGEWEETAYENLTLFMPGVYWHREGVENLLKVKTRGVPRRLFAESIGTVEDQFREWHIIKALRPGGWRARDEELEAKRLTGQTAQGWPYLDILIEFSMTSCLQALMQGDWDKAGLVSDFSIKTLSSDPHEKRAGGKYNAKKRRMDTYVHDIGMQESKPYKHVPIPEIAIGRDGIGLDEDVHATIGFQLEMLRGNDKPWEEVL